MMRSNKIVALTLTLATAGVTLGLQACRSTSYEKPPETLDVGAVGLGDINTLDPHAAGTALPILISWQMYDRLIEVGPNGEILPRLAKSWSSDESMRNWTFNIRPGVRFSMPGSGPARVLTPEDVRFSLERALKKPGYAQTLLGKIVEGAPRFVSGKVDTISGITVSGEDLRIRLSEPFAYLPERLAVSFFSIVPGGSPLEEETPPPGTGPFRLRSWDRVRQIVVLERNKDFWGKISEGCPKTLSFRVVESEAAAVEELRSGGLSWLEATSSILPLVEKETDPNIHVRSIPTTTIRLVAPNFERPRFKDHPELAVALNYATDRAAIVTALGAGKPQGGPIPQEVLPDPPVWFNFSPEKARAIISGLPPKAQIIELLVEPAREPRLISEVLRQQWESVGFKVNLKQGLADFFPRVIRGDFDLALGYYGPFVASVDQYLWPYRADAQPVPNVMRYTNQSFEAAFSKFSQTPQNQAAPNRTNMLEALKKRPPAIWLIASPRIQASRDALSVPRSSGIPLFHLLSPDN